MSTSGPSVALVYLSCLSLLCCLVCSLEPCDHLLYKGLTFGVVFSCVFVTFPYGVPGQIWYLIVLIPYLSLFLPSSLL